MSERLTNILGYLTLFAILGAIWVLFGEDPTLEQGARGDRTFEGLGGKIETVASVRLTKDGQTATLVRTEGSWSVTEKSGYAANSAKVTGFLRSMVLSERREPKTAHEERFTRLGLGADATLITLLDANGLSVAAMDMGKRTAGPAPGRSLTYIFREGDSRAWLVTALEEAEADPTWWLARPLIDMLETRVSTVRYADITLSRTEDGGAFAVEGLGNDEDAAAAWTLSEPARVFANLDFSDVQQLANPLASEEAKVEAVTRDGMVIGASLFRLDGAVWLQLSASAEEGASVDVAAEAAALNAKAMGWLYRIDDRDAGILGRTRSDFLKKADSDSASAS